MDFETLVWLAVIAFWIIGLGRGRKAARRRAGVPGTTADPSTLPPAPTPEAVTQAPASLEEALRQIREALSEASTQTRQTEAPRAPEPRSPQVSRPGDVSVAQTAQREAGQPRPARIPERVGMSGASRPTPVPSVGASSGPGMPRTFDERFGASPEFRREEFEGLEARSLESSSLQRPKRDSQLLLVDSDAQTRRAETQAEASIRSGSIEDLRQAFIWSEILGRPKSRRPTR